MNLYPYQEKIVNEVREAYREGLKAPCVVSPCGSGKSVVIAHIAKQATDKGNRVLFLVHRKELKDQITDTFKRSGVDMDLTTVGMVQTVVRRLDKTPPPALIITDENHHALAKTYRKIYDFYVDVPRLGFTATPIRLNGSGLVEVNDKLVMGPSVEWLIKNHYLSPYRYFAPPSVDLSHLKKRRGEFTSKSIDDAIKQDARVIYGDAVKHYQRLADGEQAICYCHSVEASLAAKAAFNGAGIPAAHIDAKTAKAVRDKIIADFRDQKIRVLCNVDLIGEGFDVPDCSTVIMLRPTASLSLFIQQSMRGMRYRPGKISKIIDHVGNVERHGFPDTDRVWSLKGEVKTSAGGGSPQVKMCKSCFATVPAGTMECPYCGAAFEPEAAPVEVVEGDLEEIKNTFSFTVSYKEPSDCQSMAELYALADARGYKRGWAYYQGKMLGFI